MLKKLLLHHQKFLQLILTGIGSLIGLSLIILAFQAFFDFNRLMQPGSGIINPQYIIINKSISLFNSFQKNLSAFSPEEIKKIQEQNEVTKTGSFTSNLFQASASTGGGLGGKFLPFSTELFFEALPDEFIDVQTNSWHWAEGQREVPIIIPTDYLNLYNFGFAPSQGLPQLSRSMIQMAGFTVHLSGNSRTADFTGRIVGFTDRINSILVPQSFMDYANKTYGNGQSAGPSRLVLVTKNPGPMALLKFLKENDFETNPEEQRNARFYSLMTLVFSIVLTIGALIVLMGVLGFIQYSQLLVAKSNYELKTLLQLGYKHQTLSGVYLNCFLRIYLMLFLCSIGIVALARLKINELIMLNGFEALGWINAETIVFAILLSGLLFLINAFIVRNSIRTLAGRN